MSAAASSSSSSSSMSSRIVNLVTRDEQTVHDWYHRSLSTTPFVPHVPAVAPRNPYTTAFLKRSSVRDVYPREEEDDDDDDDDEEEDRPPLPPSLSLHRTSGHVHHQHPVPVLVKGMAKFATAISHEYLAAVMAAIGPSERDLLKVPMAAAWTQFLSRFLEGFGSAAPWFFYPCDTVPEQATWLNHSVSDCMTRVHNAVMTEAHVYNLLLGTDGLGRHRQQQHASRKALMSWKSDSVQLLFESIKYLQLFVDAAESDSTLTAQLNQFLWYLFWEISSMNGFFNRCRVPANRGGCASDHALLRELVPKLAVFAKRAPVLVGNARVQKHVENVCTCNGYYAFPDIEAMLYGLYVKTIPASDTDRLKLECRFASKRMLDAMQQMDVAYADSSVSFPWFLSKQVDTSSLPTMGMDLTEYDLNRMRKAFRENEHPVVSAMNNKARHFALHMNLCRVSVQASTSYAWTYAKLARNFAEDRARCVNFLYAMHYDTHNMSTGYACLMVPNAVLEPVDSSVFQSLHAISQNKDNTIVGQVLAAANPPPPAAAAAAASAPVSRDQRGEVSVEDEGSPRTPSPVFGEESYHTPQRDTNQIGVVDFGLRPQNRDGN
jgi:hypothetical protein